MFTGHPAFQADTPFAVGEMKHVDEAPPPPRLLEPDLPERIERAILKCLEKEPRPSASSRSTTWNRASAGNPAPSPFRSKASRSCCPSISLAGNRSDWLLPCVSRDCRVSSVLFLFYAHEPGAAGASALSTAACFRRNRSESHAERLRAPITKETDIGGRTVGRYEAYAASRNGGLQRRARRGRPNGFLCALGMSNGTTDRRGGVRGSMWIATAPCGRFRAVFRKASASRDFRRKRPDRWPERAIAREFSSAIWSGLTPKADTVTREEHRANQFQWIEQGEGMVSSRAMPCSWAETSRARPAVSAPADYARDGHTGLTTHLSY